METNLFFQLKDEAIEQEKRTIKNFQALMAAASVSAIVIFSLLCLCIFFTRLTPVELKEYPVQLLLIIGMSILVLGISLSIFYSENKKLFFHKKLTQEEIKEATSRLINEKIEEAKKNIKSNQEWVVKLQEALDGVS